MARVDLKSDRQNAALLVQGAFAEEGVDVRYVTGGLAAGLQRAAGWRGLGSVVVAADGDLAAQLLGRGRLKAVDRGA